MGFQVLSEKRFLSFAEQFLLSMPYKFYYLKQNLSFWCKLNIAACIYKSEHEIWFDV